MPRLAAALTLALTLTACTLAGTDERTTTLDPQTRRPTTTAEIISLNFSIPSEWQESCWHLATHAYAYGHISRLRDPQDTFHHALQARWMAGWARSKLRASEPCRGLNTPKEWRLAARPPSMLDEYSEWEADQWGASYVVLVADECNTGYTAACERRIFAECNDEYGNWTLRSHYCTTGATVELARLGVPIGGWRVS